MGLTNRFEHAWQMFKSESNGISPSETDKKFQSTWEPIAMAPNSSIPSSTYRRSSISSMIFNRIAMDCSMVKFQHVKILRSDELNIEHQNIVSDSALQRLFDVEFNVDQSSTDFFHDLVFSLFDEGVVAAVPLSADIDPTTSSSYDIQSMRVGKIMEWYPESVRVRVYNEGKGYFSEITVPKKMVAIIENPLANILGPENPTMTRLIQKLSILDQQDSNAISNKWNMIVQLPTPVRAEIRQKEAMDRIQSLENQLSNSKLGIAYAGVEEKITQLNRPLNTNLLDEIKYLTEQLFNQIGLTKTVFDGTATADQMQNYYTRTIEPIVTRIQEEFQRKFITKTGYTQGHRITTYSDPFKLVPTTQLAQIGDALLRNQILTPNEFRAIIGYGPSMSAMADELYNPNIADANQDVSKPGSAMSPEESDEGYEDYPDDVQDAIQNGGK